MRRDRTAGLNGLKAKFLSRPEGSLEGCQPLYSPYPGTPQSTLCLFSVTNKRMVRDYLAAFEKLKLKKKKKKAEIGNFLLFIHL